jgi:hypothetical protein
MPKRVLVVLSFIVLLSSASKRACAQTSPDSRQADMDAYCAERGNEGIVSDEKPSEVRAFYSWKIHTCVQIEVNTAGPEWGYGLRDVSQGFLRGPEYVTTDLPLHVYHYDYNGGYKTVSADGFWKATDTSKEKQLVSLIAAKIHCDNSSMTCEEHDAQLFGGLLSADSQEYKITRWDGNGLLADDEDGGNCGLGHRLAIDYASNSVIVTDYPMKAGGNADCKAFQNANSYALHGGIIGIMGVDTIFQCTKDGLSRAVIAKVNALHGHVADKPYAEWMDDGKDGSPSTNKTPDHPYTQMACKQAMNKMVAQLQ